MNISLKHFHFIFYHTVYDSHLIASGDFLSSRYHLFSYLGTSVLCRLAITLAFACMTRLRFKSLQRRLLLLWEELPE